MAGWTKRVANLGGFDAIRTNGTFPGTEGGRHVRITVPSTIFVGDVLIIGVVVNDDQPIHTLVHNLGPTTFSKIGNINFASDLQGESASRATFFQGKVTGTRTYQDAQVYGLTNANTTCESTSVVLTYAIGSYTPKAERAGTVNTQTNTPQELNNNGGAGADVENITLSFASGSSSGDFGIRKLAGSGYGDPQYFKYSQGNSPQIALSEGLFTSTPNWTTVNGGTVNLTTNSTDPRASADTIDLSSTGTATFSVTREVGTSGDSATQFNGAPGLTGSTQFAGSGETSLPTAGLSVTNSIEVSGSGALELLVDTENSVFRVILNEGSGDTTFEGNPLFEEILGLMSEGILGLSDQPPVNYLDDKGNLIPVEVIGWYDGANIQPVELLGWYDGTGIRQLG